MPDENGQQGEGGAGNQGGSNGKTPIESLPQDVQEYIKSLRSEAEKTRKDAKQQLDEIRSGQQKQLEEQGNYKKLAEDRAAELAALKPFKDRTEALENVIRASNEARIKTIPDMNKNLVQPLIDVLPPERLQDYLNANPNLFVKPDAPNYDAGAGANGGSSGTSKLTAEETEIAKRMGMSPEDYAKAKAKLPKKD